MKLLLKLLLVAVVLFTTGCASYWYQDGKTFDECKAARDKCFTELRKRTDFKGMTSDYEFKFMNQCMTEQGYKAVKKSELPLDVKRQEPESSLHWRARGLAGTVKE